MFPVLQKLVPRVFLICSGTRVIDHPNEERSAVFRTANGKPHLSLKFLEIGGQNSVLDPLSTLSNKEHAHNTLSKTHTLTEHLHIHMT